ncbi:MAG: prepilin-type N-terminal cleavage/methylation domain-containing protein [Planctomycetota bacterium]|nr:prepilin-type N-terminal cleavage/methylation domain-containing protein [Planctomycetota bacterium]
MKATSLQGLRKDRGGFTLIEVVLSMGILMMGMSVLLSLLTFGAALTRSAALRTKASTVIEAVIVDLEESLFPLEADGTVGEPPELLQNRPVPGTAGVVYSAKTRPNPDNFDEYVVEVEVQWESEGLRRSKTFQTLLLREVPFGERMRRRFLSSPARPTDSN